VVHGNAGFLFVLSIAMPSYPSQGIRVFSSSIRMSGNPFDVFWHLIKICCK